MARRTHKVSTYITEDTFKWLKNVAAKQNISISRFVSRLVSREELASLESTVSKRAIAEERIQTLVNLGKDELTGIARFVEDLTARSGVYPIANWEFLKKLAVELGVNITDGHRREFLKKAAKRLREREERFEKDRKFKFGD